jgi:P4 family phage/plasmid primase-like protien
MQKTRAEILEAFARQVADWSNRFPAEAGLIRERVCAALKFNTEEFRAWLASFRDKQAIAALEESIEAELSQEISEETVIEGYLPAPDSPTGAGGEAQAPAEADQIPELREDGTLGFEDGPVSGKPGTGWLDRTFPALLSEIAGKSGSARAAAVKYLFRQLAEKLKGRDGATEALVRERVCFYIAEIKKTDYDRCMREARKEVETAAGDTSGEGASADGSDWGGLARRFLSELGENCALIRWRETWYEWTKVTGCYKAKGKEWMPARATLWMNEKGLPIGARAVGDFINAVQAMCYLPDEVSPPCWLAGLDGKIRREGSLYISMKNGILDVESVKFEMDEGVSYAPLIEHTRDFFTLNSLPYEFQPDAQCPGLEEAIALWQPKNEKDPEGLGQRLLQDWAGYILEPGQPFNVLLLNQGQGNDGKSQFRELCTAIAGVENTSTLGLEALDPQQQFGREDLLGKTLWTIPDANQIEKLGEGTLKAITGGDRVNIPRKFKSSINGPLNAKVMMSCNEVPGFRDRTEGIWRRVMMLQWFPVKKVIPNFAAKLIKEEMPGIFMWALRGWWRVRQAGFAIRGVITENVQAIRRETQHELSFFDECVEIVTNPDDVKGLGVSNNQLIKAYIEWCRLNNVKPYAHPETMGRALAKWVRWQLERADPPWGAEEIAEFLKEKNFNPRRLEEGKRRTRYYVRIRLLDQDEDERVSMQGGYMSTGKSQTAPYRMTNKVPPGETVYENT